LPRLALGQDATHRAGEEVILATTTSTADTGLLDALAPLFLEKTGITLKPIAVGSGAALELGERGEADVLLVHSPAAEEEFMAAGYGIERRTVMVNDFVLVGPAADPAGVAAASSASEAMTPVPMRRSGGSGSRIVACTDAPSLIAYPPSHQVAFLLGIETILPAQVVCIDGEHAVVTLTTCGPSLRTWTPLRATVAPGEIVTVTLPAGAVHVFGPDDGYPPGWNVLPGRVSAVTSLPSGTRLVVETPAPIIAFAPWQPMDHRWLVGDPAIVAFSPESAHVIPERAQLPIPYPSECSELNSSYGRARDGRHHGH
jgi:hypothetical protein